MAGIDTVMNILSRNKSKNFVQRILNPQKYPSLQESDGSVASHKMAWAEVGGEGEPTKYIVYPTVIYDGKRLRDYGDSAIDKVLQTGEYISFDDPEMADWFSRNYKLAWKGARQQPSQKATFE